MLLLVKLQAWALNFTKSNTPPWGFFTFLKLCKWYQIAQRITYSNMQFIIIDIITWIKDAIAICKWKRQYRFWKIDSSISCLICPTLRVMKWSIYKARRVMRQKTCFWFFIYNWCFKIFNKKTFFVYRWISKENNEKLLIFFLSNRRHNYLMRFYLG